MPRTPTIIPAAGISSASFAQDSTLIVTSLMQAPVFVLGAAGITGVQVTIESTGTLQAVGVTSTSNSQSVLIGAGVGGQASVDAIGAGASLDSGGGSIQVGAAGSGSLTVEAGARVSDGTLDLSSQYSTQIGAAAGSAGTLRVAGTSGAAHATYTVASSIVVGNAGSGLLTVASGGTLSVIQTATGQNENLDIGNATGSTGTVNVTGTDALLDAGPGAIGVGLNGAALLSVTQGGTVLASAAGYGNIIPALFIGQSVGVLAAATGSGTVRVDGSGSLLGMTGQIAVGDSESGTLTVSDHAIVRSSFNITPGKAGIGLGVFQAGTGEVTVTTGGLLDAGTGSVVVGESGTGTLAVLAGGTVLASNAGFGDLEPAFLVGTFFSNTPAFNGTGVVTVDGAGSMITSNGAVVVGDTGQGSMLISNGGTVAMTGTTLDAPAVTVAGSTGATGSITVSGTGSELNAGIGRLAVGIDGAGTLLVNQGGTVLASAAAYASGPAVEIGQYSDGPGSVTIDGAGSTLSANGAVWVAAKGAGTLVVSHGGALSAGGTNDNGTGLLVSLRNGTGSVVIDGGTLAVSDNASINAHGGVTLQDGGALSVGGTINGSGAIDLGGPAPSTVSLAGAVASSISVLFQTEGDTLALANALGMAGVIGNFVVGDAIRFAGNFTAVGSRFAGNTMTVTGDGATIATLTFAAAGYGTANTAVSDTGGVVAITTTVPCFVTGTRLRTEAGEVAVQNLAVGDRVLTAAGVLRPVRWIGHRTIVRPGPDNRPVRIAAGSFGANVPARDLLLSGDHCLLLDDTLTPVKVLVNGANVAVLPRGRVTYWHIELDTHDIVLAEGLAVETYLDTGNRHAFAGGKVQALHPDFSPGRRPAPACRPVATEGAAVIAAKTRLLDQLAWTDDPHVRLRTHGGIVDPVVVGDWLRFDVSAGPVRLLSRASVAAHARAASSDPRALGVAVTDIRLDGQPIALDDRRLGAGWHAGEPGLRWTNGDATIELERAGRLECRLVSGAMRYRAPDISPAAASA